MFCLFLPFFFRYITVICLIYKYSSLHGNKLSNKHTYKLVAYARGSGRVYVGYRGKERSMCYSNVRVSSQNFKLSLWSRVL